MNKLIKTAVVVLLVLLFLLPYINGRLAEREIRGFFKRSPVGEEAVRYYERGYLKSNCIVEFDGYELIFILYPLIVILPFVGLG